MTNAKMTAEQRKDLVQFRIATKALKSKVQDILDDLEAAESRIRALEDVVRELVDSGNSLNLFYKRTLSAESYSKWVVAEAKALSLLSEGATGEGK